MPINIPLDSITETTLQELVNSGVTEEKFIEYKETLPGASEGQKKEFLADASSFANASGGHLIFGMRAQGGIAIEAIGLDIGVEQADAAILRLEEITRDGIRPRIPGISSRAVLLSSKGKPAIIMHIPKSWAMPHQVVFNKHYRFYSRSSNGKYLLDVDELRIAFELSGAVADRVREFRAGRLSSIVSKETPTALDDDPKLILHIVPYSAFSSANYFDVSRLRNFSSERLNPLFHQSHNWRHNIDGFLTFTGNRCSYLQVFRNGIIESVDSHVLLDNGQGQRRIRIDHFEHWLMFFIEKYLSLQKDIGIQPPLFILLSLFGLDDFHLNQTA